MIFIMNGTSMDLNAVRMLVQVAEARSFTVAAGQLGLSQSGLSRAIGRLEATLGVKLLQRNTRNVALTPDGRQFVDQVAPLLCGLEDAERQLADRPCTPAGTLKISAPSMFGRKVLVPLLAPLLQQHPQLQVEAVLSDRLVDLVEEGFDAALRTGVIADQRIVARPLRPLRWVTVASPAYLARCGAPDDVAALRDHACLAVRNLRSGRLVDWQFLQDGQLREFTPPTRMVPESYGSAPAMARMISVRPAPTSPARPTISPARTVNEMSWKTPGWVRLVTSSSGPPILASCLGKRSCTSRPTMRRTISVTDVSTIASVEM